MQEMYTATINSPSTELAIGIDNITTIIEINDSTAIPDFPNLLTIGYDTIDPETVRLINKWDNFIEVERAFQGTAKTWDANTKIARVYTAYDHNSFRSNIIELQGGITPIEFITTDKFIDQDFIYIVGTYGDDWRVNRYDISNIKGVASGTGQIPTTLIECQGLTYE